MKIPKSKYNVGDRVIVRCEETPGFEATVSGVRWEGRINHVNQHWYEITEDDTGVSDGYTDEWLSPLNRPSGGKRPMKPEVNNKRHPRCLARLVVRWLLLGWWTVPLLLLGALLATILDGGGWTGGDENIFYHSDPELDAAFDWCCSKLRIFFPHNIP